MSIPIVIPSPELVEQILAGKDILVEWSPWSRPETLFGLPIIWVDKLPQHGGTVEHPDAVWGADEPTVVGP